jgi:hypothetical protein
VSRGLNSSLEQELHAKKQGYSNSKPVKSALGGSQYSPGKIRLL